MKILLSLLTAFVLLPLCASSWTRGSDTGNLPLRAESDGSIHTELSFPGGVRVFCSEDRRKFRADRAKFDARELCFEAELKGGFTHPVKAWIFVKDKDGLWYQSEKEFRLFPGETERLCVRLDRRGGELLPSGHGKTWCGEEAASIYEAGVAFYSDEKMTGEIVLHGPSYEGTRERPAFAVTDWNLPEKVEKNRMFESTFALSRDYFNSYDPKEIRVDYELDGAGTEPMSAGEFYDLLCEDLLKHTPFHRTEEKTYFDTVLKTFSRPAFYTAEFFRSKHFTEETLTPTGTPHWAFRMTPETSGNFRVRIKVTDRSGAMEEVAYSPWRTVTVEDSSAPGFVRVRNVNRNYFEFTNGEFFFPISLNIHTNTDRRSERQFRWGLLPDSGTYDYDEYFQKCGENGITLLEIWMASWTCALEWDSARTGYAGAGRYNAGNAWKLDHLFALAEKYNIHINLVLAPHGELSFRNDQEWEDNPFNRKGWYAEANGAILDSPDDFWSSTDIMELTYRRNRYIAARWGANPKLFAYEFWSEVDLVNSGRKHYNSGFMQLWHRKAARELTAMDPGRHLKSTHVCGDAGNTAGWSEICILPESITHIVSDAYRDPAISFADQLMKHRRILDKFGKPFQVTEFGGTSFGSNDSAILGDIHSGLWGSFFFGQSASPALWWHDFVHFNNVYPHYKALSVFLRGVDPGANPVFGESEIPRALLPPEVWESPETLQNPNFLRNAFRKFSGPFFSDFFFPYPTETIRSAFFTPDQSFACGWIYRPNQMHHYPADLSAVLPARHALIRLDLPMKPGEYRLFWHDTCTGYPYNLQKIVLDGAPQYIAVPPFAADIAFKLFRMEKAQ